MQSQFIITFDERDDGTKTWSATCSSCATSFVGERNPPVIIITVSRETTAIEFDWYKKQIDAAWKYARETGRPIATIEGTTVTSVPINGDLQRALEAHAEICSTMR